MSPKYNLFLILCLTKLCLSARKPAVVVRLDPKELVETFKTVISSKYIQEMADEMANKAALHFMNRIRNNNINLKLPKDRTKQLEVKNVVRQGTVKTKDVVPEKEPSIQKVKENDAEEKTINEPFETIQPNGEGKATVFQPYPPYREGTSIKNKEGVEKKERKEEGVADEKQKSPSAIAPGLFPPSKSPEPNEIKNPLDKNVLDESVAFALLKDPSPDGDDWELDSLEISEIRNSIPVVEVKKINGVYFRRFLGHLAL